MTRLRDRVHVRNGPWNNMGVVSSEMVDDFGEEMLFGMAWVEYQINEGPTKVSMILYPECPNDLRGLVIDLLKEYLNQQALDKYVNRG